MESLCVTEKAWPFGSETVYALRLYRNTGSIRIASHSPRIVLTDDGLLPGRCRCYAEAVSSIVASTSFGKTALVFLWLPSP